ncbi:MULTISPECIES: MFS transporter [unclassified Curtobacterium]|uniref:MFS transporter n=1 Tax=unclassified Curtobacterium TaxID=257496 RepID=UPI000DA754D6|nr:MULTISPECIES: MFS transporter [unclassified Curtobacterium]PZE27115.1 MFS transporter [Curtobacterium sp. MCBD17_028]PZE74772.1 MFS transporter [Curtobacterium sp. MCBD17_019]PZF62742.1 MFS transporter [Curtobacterium sp. MCBD17_013]WIB63183.1 MFS transporter [Curtobacterium sp. MCBD17_040]WIE54166.1 MFS transporter [Curtobacterium sp. MCBD17_003]
MSTTTRTPEQRRKGFLARMTFACAWGEGLDGFDLGLISVVLPLISTALHVNALEAGLIGASSLIGIFVGAPLTGLLTDRFGRKTVFTVDIIAFVVLGLLQAFVTDAWQLLAVRIALGIAIGAEYSIGAAMLAEFAPAKSRGRRLSGLLVCWYAGYLAAVVVGYALVDLGHLNWRWVLATSILPAIVTVIVRIGFPESPRWLLHRGREQEARAVIDQRLGGGAYYEQEDYGSEEQKAGGYRALFAPGNRKRVTFIAVFWACNVAPYFAIFTFAPTVLKSLALHNETAGTITVNGMAAVGALVGMLTIERIGRRPQLIPPFWIMAVALAVVGFWGSAPGAVVVVCFAVFSFMNALQGNLTAVYPIEVFPTEVRSTGVGFTAACSRVGAAAGTFLLPVGITTLGIGPCMLIAAAICVVGAIVSQVMAPETTGRGLHDTSTGEFNARALQGRLPERVG